MLNPLLPRGAAALACCLLALACTGLATSGPQSLGGSSAGITDDSVRVLSWNVSDDAFVRDARAFRALLARADADILLFDEVTPAATEGQLRAALAGRLRGSRDNTSEWHISLGQSGGRQRGVVASRFPLERVPELSGIVPYPALERDRIRSRMAAGKADRPAFSMDGGIPVNGAIAIAGARRLLVVIVDLQCCGNDPESWEEDRRRVEAREIRRLVEQVLTRTRVDGVVVAGDFNAVSTPLPVTIVAGPYPLPHAGLIAADLRHLDGVETWTWDGRGSPFPSRPLDFMLYSASALDLRRGFILDSADLGGAELAALELDAQSAGRLSKHLPLLAEFVWH